MKLSKANLKKVDTFHCGKIRREWTPGRMVKGYFYSHKAERANLARSLKKATKRQRVKIQAQIVALDALAAARTPLCSGNGNNNGGGSGGGTGASSSLKFDLSGATGLVLSDQNIASATFSDADGVSRGTLSEANSNLKKVLSGGGLANVLSKGKAQIAKFLVGPNDKLYVLFSQTCLYGNNCSERCLLGEVDTRTGDMTCVDNSLGNFNWSYSANNVAPSSKPLQFDSAGNLYYMGTADGMTVLRKYNSATKTAEDLINANIQISGYLVLADGSILYSGYTQSSSLYWLRKRLPDGRVVPIATGLNVGWMALFPDGRAYLGAYWTTEGYYPKIFRLRQDSEEIEAVPWVGTNGFGSYNPIDSYYQFDRAGMLHTTAGSVFSLHGYPPSMTLFRLFPVPHVIPTSLKSITGIKPVLSDLIVYGTDEDGYGRMVLYDTKTGNEENLLGNAQLEVYRVEYLLSDNAVQFDALRFSDGKYVLCTVYLDDINALACSPTGSVKLADFQSVATPGVRIPPPAVSPTPIALLEHDFSGAKAVIGTYKVSSEGSVNPAARFAAGRVLPEFRGDDRNNLLLLPDSYLGSQGFYITDQDTRRCRLARVSSSGGVPTCVYSGDEAVQLIRSQPQGGTFFVTSRQEANQSPVFKLFYVAVGQQAVQIASWSGASVMDAMVTPSGSLLVSTLNWVRNFSSTGEFVAHDIGSAGGWQRLFGRLPDGRALVTGAQHVPSNNLGIASISADGEELNSQLYSSASPGAEVECAAANDACGGYQVIRVIQAGPKVYGIGWNNNITSLLAYAPGPVSAISFAQPFTPSDIVIGTNTKIFMYGSRNSAPTLLSYDVTDSTESNLTDDPALSVRSMQFIEGQLYLAGTKSTSGNDQTCELFVGIKTLGGGTSLSKVGSAMNCWALASYAPPLVKF